MNVSDKRLEEALIYRAESDEKHAELKTKVEFLEWQKKHKKGIFINTKCDEKTSFSIKEQKWFLYILFSAITFGLLLNFRSDYILMPVGLTAICLWTHPILKTFKKIFLWVIILYTEIESMLI